MDECFFSAEQFFWIFRIGTMSYVSYEIFDIYERIKNIKIIIVPKYELPVILTRFDLSSLLNYGIII